jgi:hypothetical protein
MCADSQPLRFFSNPRPTLADTYMAMAAMAAVAVVEACSIHESTSGIAIHIRGLSGCILMRFGTEDNESHMAGGRMWVGD